MERYPLGVVASINPFNFPSMVPHWTIPNAIALGNTFIMKPSELVPLSAGRIADLLKEAGLPDGVFNVVHGDREVAEALCDHPGVEAVTFVGSTAVAQAGLPPRHRQPEAGALPGRRQEPRHRHAGRRSRDGGGRRAGRDGRLHRPALHGGIGDAGGVAPPITSCGRLADAGPRSWSPGRTWAR